MRLHRTLGLVACQCLALPLLVSASCPGALDDPCTTAWTASQWASYHALLWISRIALFAVALVAIWRFAVVARDKIASKPFRSCLWADGQLRILALNAGAAVIWAVASLDPLGIERIVSRLGLFGFSLFGTLLNLLSTGLMVRFFAVIVSKFHARTKKVVTVLDVLCALLLINEIVGIMLAWFVGVFGIVLYFIGIALFTAILVIGASIYAPIVLTSKMAHVRVTDEERRARQQLLRLIRAMQCTGTLLCAAVLWVAFQPNALNGEPMEQALGWFAIVDTVECGVGLGTCLVMGRTAKSSASVAPAPANAHAHAHSPVGSSAEPLSPGSSTANARHTFSNGQLQAHAANKAKRATATATLTIQSPRSDDLAHVNHSAFAHGERDKSTLDSMRPTALEVQISDVKEVAPST